MEMSASFGRYVLCVSLYLLFAATTLFFLSCHAAGNSFLCFGRRNSFQGKFSHPSSAKEIIFSQMDGILWNKILFNLIDCPFFERLSWLTLPVWDHWWAVSREFSWKVTTQKCFFFSNSATTTVESLNSSVSWLSWLELMDDTNMLASRICWMNISLVLTWFALLDLAYLTWAVWLDLVCSSDVFTSSCAYIHMSRGICEGKHHLERHHVGVIGTALRENRLVFVLFVWISWVVF